MKPLYISKSYNRDLHFPEKKFTFIALFRFHVEMQASQALSSQTFLADESR